MEKFTLTLNSHSLSNFQKCEAAYMFGNLVGIEPIGGKFALKRGSIVARYLNLYYYNKMRPKELFKKCLSNAIFWTRKIALEVGIDQGAAFNLYSALFSYGSRYRDEKWIPIGVEKGFSKILYEDEENLFVYEGSIDLVAMDPHKLIIVDHKTEAANRPIYEFNNQCIGYLWASGATEFIYNYITLTKTPDFHRRVHQFSELQIQDWVNDTIKWFFRIKHSIQRRHFLKSKQCVGIYGKCSFTAICEQPKDDIKKHVITSSYKKVKPWRSW